VPGWLCTRELHGSDSPRIELARAEHGFEGREPEAATSTVTRATETISERFERDHAAMLPLPAAPYEACERIAGRVSSLSLVRYRLNDYSVPTEYGQGQVWVKGYVPQVVIACGSEVIARLEIFGVSCSSRVRPIARFVTTRLVLKSYFRFVLVKHCPARGPLVA
jgi:hypothetical protein